MKPRFKAGDIITPKRGRNPATLFEHLDCPLRLTFVNVGFYFWKPRYGKTTGGGDIERIDRDYRMLPTSAGNR